MKTSKDVWVHFTGEVNDMHVKLQETVIEEKERGLRNSLNMQLLRAIDREVDNLKIDPQRGIYIPKRNIPRELFERYQTENFWKINLPNYWRMIYTLTGNEVEVIALVLEVMDHRKYDKLLKYRKK